MDLLHKFLQQLLPVTDSGYNAVSHYGPEFQDDDEKIKRRNFLELSLYLVKKCP